MMTAAVGLIETKEQMEEILSRGQADLVLMARGFLRDPYWPLHNAQDMKHDIAWPAQYLRVAPPNSPIRSPFTMTAHEDRGRNRDKELNRDRTSGNPSAKVPAK